MIWTELNAPNRFDTMFIVDNVTLLLLFFVHMSLGDDPHDAIRAKCQNENGLTEDEAREGFTKMQPKLGCYVVCLMLGTDVMNADGIMSPEKLTIEVGQDLHDEAESTIFACDDETKSIEDACEKMVKYFECFQEKNPTTYAKLGVFGKPGLDRKY